MSEQVTILAARFWPDTHGGVETHLWQFAQHLAAAGVRVQVLTENRGGLAEVERVNDNLTIRRAVPPSPDWRWRWWPLVQIAWWRDFVKQHAPSGVVWASNPILAAAAIRAGVADRTIFNPAACAAAMRKLGRLYPHADTLQLPWLLARIERFAYTRSPRVVVSSNNVSRQFTEFHGPHEHLQVLPLATTTAESLPSRDAARAKWSIDANAFVAGFVGRLDPLKDLDLLFKAFATAPLAATSKLLIVGDGPDKARLQRLAEEMRITPRVIWAGSLADPTAAYAAMDTFVLPSVYEAFGMVLQEAMAAGVPVIGRRGNGRDVLTASDEIIQHERHGFIVDNVNDLAQRFVELERDTALRQRLGGAGAQDCRHRTWPLYTQEAISRLNLGGMHEASDQTPYRRAA